jgi:hypothetical protein
LPDVVPQVSFDRRLGESLEYIDFDYENYCEYMTKRGVDEPNLGQLSIHYQASRVVSVIDQASAFYRSDLRQIKIGVSKKKSLKEINELTAHETEHFILDVTNQRGGSARGMHFIHKLGLAASYPLIGLGLYDKYSDVINSSFTYETEAKRATIAAGAAMVISALAYTFNPEERQAKAAAKQAPSLINRFRRSKN